jgi:hypothetical protein
MAIALDSVTNMGVDILATDQALHTYPAALQSGELQQFNRLAGGTIWQHSTAITSTAAVAVCASPCIYGGLMVLSSGSGTGTLSAWDGSTATGTTWQSSAVMVAANTFVPAVGTAGGAQGVLMNVGLTVQQSSGCVFYALFAPST